MGVKFAKSNGAETDHNRWTDEVIVRICATGQVFFGDTTWRGRRAMRVSIRKMMLSAVETMAGKK